MQRTIKRLDYGIVLLTIFLSIILLCRFCFSGRKTVERPLPVFPAPTRLLPRSLELKLPRMNINASVSQRKSAESFFVQACHSLDKANFYQAAQFIDQAIAIDPGNRKYHRAAAIARAELTNRKNMDLILTLVKGKNYDQAWDSFLNSCNENYLFYSRYAARYAGVLEQHQQNASAAMLMRSLHSTTDNPRGEF